MTLCKKNCFKVTDKPSEIRRLKALGYEEVVDALQAPEETQAPKAGKEESPDIPASRPSGRHRSSKSSGGGK